MRRTCAGAEDSAIQNLRPSGRRDFSKNDSFLLVRRETEAQRPGDAGSGTQRVEGQERARTQALGFPVLGCGSFGVPLHLSTLLDPQSKEDLIPRPLRPVDVAPPAGHSRDDD